MTRLGNKQASLADYQEKFVLSLEYNTQGIYNKEYINDDRDSFELHLIYPYGTRLFMENEEGLKEEILLGSSIFSESLPNTYFRISQRLELKEVDLEKIRKINVTTTQFSYQMP